MTLNAQKKIQDKENNLINLWIYKMWHKCMYNMHSYLFTVLLIQLFINLPIWFDSFSDFCSFSPPQQEHVVEADWAASTFQIHKEQIDINRQHGGQRHITPHVLPWENCFKC